MKMTSGEKFQVGVIIGYVGAFLFDMFVKIVLISAAVKILFFM